MLKRQHGPSKPGQVAEHVMIDPVIRHDARNRGRRLVRRAPNRGATGPDLCCSAESQAASRSEQRTPPSAAHPYSKGHRARSVLTCGKLSSIKE